MNKVDPKQSLPRLEEEILNYWEENKIFEKSVERPAGREPQGEYVFYDGPPFATGTPHYGHIVANVLKDAVPRYWTMRGFRVRRRWGWDCHGLPIENIAEKELGIGRKKDIEAMGVAKFNEFCRSKVLEYADEWKKVIPRIGRFVDMDHPYRTMDRDFMESVWWVFRELWDKGLVYEGYRAMHICPRCETTLSQQEVSENYATVKDLSATVKFELADEPGTYVLAWTTTPWTLPGNVALAVKPNTMYVRLKINEIFKNETNLDLKEGETYILEESRVMTLFGSEIIDAKQENQEDYFKIDSATVGSDDEKLKLRIGYEIFHSSILIGKRYKPLFDVYVKNGHLEHRENGWKIYAGDFVTTDEGTGVVHIAPAFGEDDLNLGRQYDLPFVQHVGMDGIIKNEKVEFFGRSVTPRAKDKPNEIREVDLDIVNFLKGRGDIFRNEKYEHSYPLCWRCDTPLLNYATSSWFVRVTGVKDRAIELAKEIDWSPAHVKAGRFGKWLEGARDWSISRQRFWATPMPIWKCGVCEKVRVFGSVAELEEAGGGKIDDLHKHVVDGIVVLCGCGGEMRRIADVLDTWFDSGSMPYAERHYPFEGKEIFEQQFPAQFIAEGIDQTRAWFYYLHVMGTALFDRPAYRNVVVNGIVQAEDGKKMSKKLRNYPDPMDVVGKYGADTLRLYLLSSPVVAAENINFSEKEMGELSRGLFRMLWNSYSFFVMYAEIDGWKPSFDTRRSMTNILDRWILSELQMLAGEVHEHMERYDIMRAARAFAPFIDNLSNWYIRRSRKRFWKNENDDDKNDAYQTLYDVLVALSKLMAPFTPFLAEEIYHNLTGEESVHLAGYPKSDESPIDHSLSVAMSMTREMVSEGLQLRSVSKVKVRQPLSSIRIPKKYEGPIGGSEYLEIIQEELNVKEVVFGNPESAEDVVMLDVKITPELRLEGQAREIIRVIQDARKAAGYEVSDRIVIGYERMEAVFADTALHDMIVRETLAEGGTRLGVLEDADIEKSVDIDGEPLTFWLKKVVVQ